MVATIVRHELRCHRRDGRLRWAVGIVFTLLVAALASGWHYQHRLRLERQVAQRAEQARWLGQGEKNPHSAAHYGVYAFKPASTLAAIDPGIEPFVGVSVWLEAHNMNLFLHRPVQDGTALTRFGELTAALTLQVLLPLLVILITFGAFAVERERGTLRQLLGLGVPAGSLARGKLLATGTVLALVLVPAVVLACLAVLLHTPGGGAANGLRFAGLVLVYLLYLTGWGLATLALSARARRARTALVVALGLWVLGCLALPRTAADLAARIHPVPSAAAFREGLEREMDPAHGSARALAARDRVLRDYGVSRVEDLPIDWRGISLQEGEERNYPIFDRHFGDLFERYRAQDRVLQAAGLIAPLLAAQSLSQALAGTDFEHHRRFVFAAERQRRVMQEILNRDVTLHDREGTDYRAGPELWARIPPFRYQRPSLREILAHYRLAMCALGLWLTGTAAAALVYVRGQEP